MSAKSQRERENHERGAPSQDSCENQDASAPSHTTSEDQPGRASSHASSENHDSGAIDLDFAPVVEEMGRDLRATAANLTEAQARYFVDRYYAMQENRKRSGNQKRAAGDDGEPHRCATWLKEQDKALERRVATMLDVYSRSQPMGIWARQILGIGPIIAAGLLAHIRPHWQSIDKKTGKVKSSGILETVGDTWRFAGLDPTQEWKPNTKRPWNASLKVLCWKIGESFVKVSGEEKSYYGRVYRERYAYEWKRNRSGELADQAKAALTRKRFGDDTESRLWYEGRLSLADVDTYFATPSEKRQGIVKKLAGEIDSGVRMLPPAHIHARAKRYAVKLFLAHYVEELLRQEGRKPPLPYPIAFLGDQGHRHIKKAPVMGVDGFERGEIEDVTVSSQARCENHSIGASKP